MTVLNIEPLDYALKSAALKRQLPRARRRVVFLIHAPETFSALEPVIEELQRRADRFELLFFALPRNYTGERGTYEGARRTRQFLAERGLAAPVLQGQQVKDLVTLVRLAPDFIFRQSPWERHLPALFGAGMLGFSRLCYVPYGLMTVDEPKRQYNQEFHNACELIFCESEFHAEEFAQHRALGGLGVHLSGYPRFAQIAQALAADDGQGWPIDAPGHLPRVIWAPHHAVDASWLGLSTFMHHHQRMLEEARRGRISLLVRPHPALPEKLVHHGLMSLDDYNAWCAAIDATAFARIDRAADYIPAFAASDALITDGVGFFADYLLTGKPLIRTRRPDGCALNAFGQWMVEACRNVDDAAELDSLLDELGECRYVDPFLEARLQRQALLLQLGDGAARRIADVLDAH